MKIIAKPRGTGKTTQLIKMSAESGDYIVSKDHNMARHTVELAKKMGLEIPFPLTFDEFLAHGWNRVNGFLIDDAEILIMKVFDRDPKSAIHAITISTDDGETP